MTALAYFFNLGASMVTAKFPKMQVWVQAKLPKVQAQVQALVRFPKIPVQAGCKHSGSTVLFLHIPLHGVVSV